MEARENSPYPDLNNPSKQAADVPAGPNYQHAQFQGHQAGQLLNRQLWQTLLGALAVGGAGRLGLGAMRLASHPGSGPEASPASQRVGLEAPAPEEDEEEKYAGLTDKTAEMAGGAAGLPGSSMALDPSALAEKLAPIGEAGKALSPGVSGFDPAAMLSPLTRKFWDMPLSARDPTKIPSFMNWLRGARSSTSSSIPLAIPLAVLLGGGGLAAGYSGTDKVLDARHRKETDTQLDKAKKRYSSLLKTSADEQLTQELDELAELTTKAAAEAPPAAGVDAPIRQMGWDAIGLAGGTYLGYAVLSAIMSGKLGYDYFRRRGSEGIGIEALARRAKERTGGMSPIQFDPQPAQALA